MSAVDDAAAPPAPRGALRLDPEALRAGPVSVDVSWLLAPDGDRAAAGSLLSPSRLPRLLEHARAVLQDAAALATPRLSPLDDDRGDDEADAAAGHLLAMPGTIHVVGGATAAVRLFESARRPPTRARRIRAWDGPAAVDPHALAPGDAVLLVDDDASARAALPALASAAGPGARAVAVTGDAELARELAALGARVVAEPCRAGAAPECRALGAAGSIAARLFGHDAAALRAQARTRLRAFRDAAEEDATPPASILLPVLLHHVPLTPKLHEERRPKEGREGVYALSLRNRALWGVRDWVIPLLARAIGPEGPAVYASRGPKDDHIDLQQWSDAHLSVCWFECLAVEHHPHTDPAGDVVSGRHLEPAYRGIRLNGYVRQTTLAALRSLNDYRRGAVVTTAWSVDHLGDLLAELLLRSLAFEVLSEQAGDGGDRAKPRAVAPSSPAVRVGNPYTGWTAELDAFGPGRIAEATWRAALGLARAARGRIGEERHEKGEHAHAWLRGPAEALEAGRPGLYRAWFRGLMPGVDHLIVAGTGGATAGGDLARTWAARTESRWRVAVFDSPDTDVLDDHLRHELAGVDPRRVAVVNVTASGLTVDTQLIVDHLRSRLPGATFAHVTSREVGIARRLAREMGEVAFDTDPDVGDRFALDARPLVPLAALDAEGRMSLDAYLHAQRALIDAALDPAAPVEGDVAFSLAAALGALLDTRYASAPGQPPLDPAQPARVNLVLLPAPEWEPLRESMAQVFSETWGQRGAVVSVLSHPGAAAARLAREAWRARATDVYLLVDGLDGGGALDEAARLLRGAGHPVLRLRPAGDVDRLPEERLAELMVLLRMVAMIRPRADDIRRQLRKDSPLYSQEGVAAARYYVRRLAAHDEAARNPLRHAADHGLALDFFSAVLQGPALRDLLFGVMGERRRPLEAVLEAHHARTLLAAAERLGAARLVFLREGRRVRVVETGAGGENAVYVEPLDDPAAGGVWGGPLGSWLTLAREGGLPRTLATVMLQLNYTASAIVANHTVVPPLATDFVLDQAGEIRGAVRKTPVAPLFQLADHGRILAVDNVSGLPPLLRRFYYASLDQGAKPRTSGTVKDVTNVLGENGCLIRRATALQVRLQLAPLFDAAEGEWLAFTRHGPVEGAGLDALLRSGRLGDEERLVFVGGCRLNVREVGAFLKPGILSRFVDALEEIPAAGGDGARWTALLALRLRDHARRHGDRAAGRRLHAWVRARVHGPLLESIAGRLERGEALDAADALIAGGMDELQARPGLTAGARRALHAHEAEFPALDVGQLAARAGAEVLAALAAENADYLRATAFRDDAGRDAPPPAPRPWPPEERARRLRDGYLHPLHLPPERLGPLGDGPPPLGAFLRFCAARGAMDPEVGGIVAALAGSARRLLLDPASVLRDPRIGDQATKTLNVRFDDSKILDLRAQERVEAALRESGCVGVYGGEERDGLLVLDPERRWVVILDEWDGSSVIPHRGAGAYASFHVIDAGAPVRTLGAATPGPAPDALAERIFRGRTVRADSVATGWFAMGSQPSLVLALRGDRGAHVFWLDHGGGDPAAAEFRYGQHVAGAGARIRPGVAIAAGGSRNLWQPPAVDYAVCYLELQMGARLTYHGASMNDFQRSILGEEPFEGGAALSPGGFIYPAMRGRPRGFFSHLYEGAIFTLLLENLGHVDRAGVSRAGSSVVALVPRTDAAGVPRVDAAGDYVVDRTYLDTTGFDDVNTSIPLFAVAGPVMELLEYVSGSPRYRALLDEARRLLALPERVAALALNELVRRMEVERFGGSAASLDSHFIDVAETLGPAGLAARADELREIAAAVPAGAPAGGGGE